MSKYRLKGQQLIVVFIVGTILFNYPLLLVFSQNTRIAGLPLLYLYVFTSWAILIVSMAVIIERHK